MAGLKNIYLIQEKKIKLSFQLDYQNKTLLSILSSMTFIAFLLGFETGQTLRQYKNLIFIFKTQPILMQHNIYYSQSLLNNKKKFLRENGGPRL